MISLLLPYWRLFAIGGAAAVLITSCVARDRSIERKTLQKIENANAQAVSGANRAGRKSRDPSSGGVFDPYARPD